MPSDRADKADEPKIVRPLPWRRWLSSGLPFFAVVAAVVLFLRRPTSAFAPLPSYAVSVGAEPTPGGPSERAARLHLSSAKSRESRYELTLRPASAPQEKVVAYAFSTDATGTEPTPLDAKLETSAEGAIRISGRTAPLAQASEIRVVIGEPAAVGGFEAALARAASKSSERSVLVVSVPIDRD